MHTCRLSVFVVLSIVAWGPYATVADEPTAAASLADPLLRHFAGVWRTSCEVMPSQWAPDGGKTSVQEVTAAALQGRYILAREHSQPDNRKSLWLMTHDAPRNVYAFWLFDSSGLLGAQWELSWDAATSTATGHATDLPAGWTSSGTNRFPDGQRNIVDYWLKDETGTLLMQAHAEKQRQPEAAAAEFLAAWSQSEHSADRPAELDQLEPMLGTWDAVTVMHPAVWTPAEQRVTSVVTREWVLNQRFLLDRSTHSDGQESLSLIGYDPQRKEFRGWWFNSEGHRNTSRAHWSADGQTFTSRADLEDGKVVRGTLTRTAPDREEWQFLVTDDTGTVYFSSTIQATKRAASSTTAVTAPSDFDGTWKLTYFERDGQPVQLQAETLWIQQAGRFTIRRGDTVIAAGTSKLDPSQTPMACDVTYTAGPDAGRTFQGIYEVTGDTTRFCRAGSPDAPRPREFRTEPGSGGFVSAYQRVQP